MPVDVGSMQFDGRLTRIAVDYKNKQFIADQVLPPIPVPSKTGKYKVYSQAEEFQIDDALVGPNSEPNEIDYKVTEDTFAADDYALVMYVSQEAIDNADAPLSPLRVATEKAMRHLMRRRERRVAQAVMNKSNFAAANQIDIAGAWTTLTTDIVSQILVGIDACSAPPNVMVMDIATWRKVSRNTPLLAAAKGTLREQFISQTRGPAKTGALESSDAVSVPQLAEFLGLDYVFVGAAQYATSVKGQATLTKGRIWDMLTTGGAAGGGGAALLRVATGAIEDVIWGAQMQWKPPTVMTWREEKRGAYGSVGIKVAESSGMKVVANDAGYLFEDTLVT